LKSGVTLFEIHFWFKLRSWRRRRRQFSWCLIGLGWFLYRLSWIFLGLKSLNEIHCKLLIVIKGFSGVLIWDIWSYSQRKHFKHLRESVF
jgi:hypothetical protein